MMKLLLPIILLLIGVGSGVGAGLFLKPEPDEVLADGNPCGDIAPAATEVAAEPEIPEEREYAKLNNQFIVPVVKDGNVAAMVILSLNLEVALGSRSAVFEAEPKLRDSFLQAMFDHANNGGFSGNFTSGENMRALRNDLRRRAQQIIGPEVSDVLIIDIVRQDS